MRVEGSGRCLYRTIKGRDCPRCTECLDRLNRPIRELHDVIFDQWEVKVLEKRFSLNV